MQFLRNQSLAVITVLLIGSFIALAVFSCSEDKIVETLFPDVLIELDPAESAALSKKIKKEIAVTLADGLELTLWASDTLVNDPVAISVDPQGGIYYTHAERITNSEFDIRGYRDWMTTSQSWESVEDRRKFLKETFAPSKSDENTFLDDLNNDGSHDWLDLTIEKEKIWRLEDSDGDGYADRSRLYLEDFHEEVTDLANGVEFFDGEVFIAVGPDLWRTKDTDGDGVVNTTESISHGYAVHIGFGAHGMSGVTVGPDGRVWWGIGDIGMNVVDQDGKRWKYPNQGVIVRCEVDGSNFEVFSAGHRNTHEFAFDKYGNLISEDNDGDHGGERERLVYVVEGSDSGWRSSWQYGKYTDPDNNGYNVWMDEKMSVPRWEGQAAYILPPLTNYVNGPTGFVYNPGTALDDSYKDHFFVAEFRGTPARSPIHAFTLKPNGATFELDETKEIVKGTLPTGLDFGPDGALYFGDWIDGWGAKDYGRMWKLDVTDGQSAKRKAIQKLIQTDFEGLDVATLSGHLSSEDMRVRQKAQFELAKRADEGFAALKSVAVSGEDQLARIHGLWGMGQIARRDGSQGKAFMDFIGDEDPEIVTQALKLMGDVRYKAAAASIIPLLSHANDRVKFYAAESLGRMEYAEAVTPILAMLEKNNDKDAWLRHAGSYALYKIGNAEPLRALYIHPSKAVRTAAVISLRRMRDEGLSAFLKDKSEFVVAEAARAINDDLSVPGALPALADLLNSSTTKSEVILRRAINANLRVGNAENLTTLVAYVQNTNAPGAMRAEALAALSTWAKPSLTDRVDGRYRGEIERDGAPVKSALEPIINALLTDKDSDMQTAATKAVAKFGITAASDLLMEQLVASNSSDYRAAILRALSEISAGSLPKALELGLADESSSVRAVALELLPDSEIEASTVITLFKKIMEIGSVEEKQSAMSSLGGMKSAGATSLLEELFASVVQKDLQPEIQLDILDAMEASENEKLVSMSSGFYDELSKVGSVEPYKVALEGGVAAKGRRIFYQNKTAQCVRCHAVFEYGGDAGPSLTGVGNRMTKEQLLESMIEPSATLAQGYGVVSLEMKDGESMAGFLISEDDMKLTIKQGKEDILEVVKSDIKDRTDVPSSMPSVKDILTKKEVRDLVAFLTSIKMES